MSIKNAVLLNEAMKRIENIEEYNNLCNATNEAFLERFKEVENKVEFLLSKTKNKTAYKNSSKKIN